MGALKQSARLHEYSHRVETMIPEQDSAMAVKSAIGTSISVLMFGVAIFVPEWAMFAYASSMGIAICFLSLTIANESFTSSKMYARLSIAFAIIYCTLVCIVYYTQLSFVRLGSPSPEALSIVAYTPPRTAFFALDILGYFFMPLSVFFLGLTMDTGLLLRKLLMSMGLWGGTCIAVPLLPFFYEQSDSSSDAVRIIALFLWSILFFPHDYAGQTLSSAKQEKGLARVVS